MAGGDWEVVGGKSKKVKPKSPGGSKSSKDNMKDAVLRMSAPIKESETIYSALIPKEKKEVVKTNGTVVSKTDKTVPKKKKPEKKPEKRAPPKPTLENAMSLITDEDLKNHLATLEVLAPNAPLLWLKDLASYLNVKLDVSVEDLTFSGKPSGYPSVLLNRKVHKTILGLFHRSTPQMLQILHEFYLKNLVTDCLKGFHTMGYRIMLQCLAHESPSVVFENLNKCEELCNSYRNRQDVCVSVLWAAGQVGNNNPEAGLDVWFRLMFPLIGSKSCTSFCVEYLENLLSNYDPSLCKKSLLDVRDLFPILDFIHSKDLAKNIQKRLLLLYPTLKALSYGPEPDKILRNYFPSYLRRLEPQCPPLLKEEILKSLVHCLETDLRCYSIWRQLYTKHFLQSKLLIDHLNTKLSSISKGLPRRCLRDTLAAFQVTNEELTNDRRKSPPELRGCMSSIKELLSKLNAGSISWPRFFFVMFMICCCVLTIDVMIHGSFERCYIGKFIKNSGLLVVFGQAGVKLKYFYDKFLKLMAEYLPLLVPVFETCLERMREVAVFVWNTTLPLRVWCHNNIPQLLNVAEVELGKLFRTSAVWLSFVATRVISTINSFAHWLETSPEVLQAIQTVKNVAFIMMENIQKNLTYLFHLVESYIYT